MSRISKLELLTEFGFTRDPFRNFSLKSSDHTRIGKVVNMAVKDRAMVSVVGERGIGKSNAVRSALGNLQGVRPVYPYSNDINKLLISDIEQALILDLSNEKPKRGREIRARQLRRILGEASTRLNVVLVIEEAHHLHGMTLRSLKRLREMEWMGESQLFSVILVCQSDPMSKPGVSEVRLRSDSLHMNGLSQKEVVAFVNRSVGQIADNKAIEAISKLPGTHNYEDLKAMLYQFMETALFAGRKQVTTEDIESVFGGGNLEEMRKQSGMSKAELSRRSGISQPTVSKLLQSDNDDNLSASTKEKKDILGNVLKQYRQGDSSKEQQTAMG